MGDIIGIIVTIMKTGLSNDGIMDADIIMVQ